MAGGTMRSLKLRRKSCTSSGCRANVPEERLLCPPAQYISGAARWSSVSSPNAAAIRARISVSPRDRTGAKPPSLFRLARALKGRLPLIGVGGISSGADAREKIACGAALVQLYTGLVYRGPALVSECVRALAAGSEP